MSTSMRLGLARAWTLGMVAVAMAALPHHASVAAAPPDDTFDLTITSDPIVAPGGTITFEGTCWSSIDGAAERALVRGARVLRPGTAAEPFDFWAWVPVDRADGSLSGQVRVPGDAPGGRYSIQSSCTTQDQHIGVSERSVTVDGTHDVSPTTTQRSSPIEPAPAVPQPDRVTLAG